MTTQTTSPDVREVPLYGKRAAGRVALVDDADYELVSQYRWHVWEQQRNGRSHGPYAQAQLPGRVLVRMHRLLTGWPLTDHADRNGLNNQRSNLRPATSSESMANRPLFSNNQSGFKGVYRIGSDRWRAQIRVDRKLRHLGYFRTAEEAARAYDEAANKAFGVYASPNRT
jgi:hypothetical protein